MSKLYNIEVCMEDLEEVVDIIYEQWGKFFRKTKSERIAEFKTAVENNLDFPKLYVMKESDQIIGTFTIKEMDVEKKGKFPSVWYLVVKKQFRGKGYGRELIQFLDNVCKNYNQTYLVTEHTGLYEKIGFEFVKNIEHNGQIDRLYLKVNS